MAETTSPQPVYLKDYRVPAYLVDEVELRFALDPQATVVEAALRVRRNGEGPAPLVLDGRAMELLSVALDGRALPAEAFSVDAEHLTIPDVPRAFTLTITNKIAPAANTTLMGLYVSNGIFCTQCEAQGFRRITYFPDRPDVMARYRVRIEADKAACPVLLSNGNLLEKGDLEGGRHFVQWEDPFPKPAYLFALVAGDLACLEDSFVTRSGRKVALRIYAEQEAIGQCGHAMDSLKRSMQWDEDVYGLEYDLDLFQIVGVADFNFGAMENKGLNIFNTSAMLARSDTSTDVDFQHVERVIAHEYFHNWTGDRVTCRDWFQLTLKEGLTVFRDQQFSADMHSAAVKRIAEVALLREGQFAEDAGPLAHPIRPDSYVEINNFYTRTVYDKGAEVIRMIHTLIGAEAFRKGMDLYIERHDGKAVTCEDFLAAMADASGRDFSAFKRWYGQAGTPEIKVERHYDPERQTFTLELSQSTPPTPGQPTKRPLHIPVSMGLVGRGGGELPLQLEGENEPRGKARLLELTDERQSFVFVNVEAEPVPSLLRGFSAPVRLDAGYSPEELGVLMKHDSDPFARWEAAQTLATGLALDQVRRFPERGEVALDDTLVEAFAALLDGPMDDPAFLARALSLPGRSFVAQQLETISVEALHATFKTFQQELGTRLRDRWRRVYLAQREADNTIIDTPSMGRRALGNVCLAYLVWSGGEEEAALAQTQYRNAATMTNRLAALRLLAESGRPEREALLADFYAAWKDEPLVVNKWFALQAAVEEEGTVERVKELTRHPAFTMGNPNRVRALFGIFAAGNMLAFHRPDGQGYALVADRVLELDGANPQVAARLLTAFGRWRRFDAARQRLMQAELKRILAAPGLSRDCHEIASKSLG